MNVRNVAFWCGSVRVVRGKKPGYSLLCAEATCELSDGQRLRVMRLRAGLTIREAAEKLGICRHTLMNYESGRTAVKRNVSEKLQLLYHNLLSGIT
ncbi:MAG: helix-turn-helix transcriptional regulator [Oscillospiraceae bacterium]|nr:helix-turn-helix transcriptional regulator [Oscillospiraceae bacterium]